MFFITSAISFLIVFFIDTNILLWLLIVLGYGHFLMSYIYSHKAGKINHFYIKKFLIAFSIFLFISYIAFINKQNWVFDLYVVSTLLFFVFHYFNDEFKISELSNLEIRNIGRHAVLLSFFSYFLNAFFNVPASSIFIILLCFVSLSYGIFFTHLFIKENNSKEKLLFFIFFILNLTIPFYFVFIKMVHPYVVAGFIIIFHYIRWYLRYIVFFKGEKLKEYIYILIFCNILFIFLFYLHTTLNIKIPILFEPTFFYCWVIVHIIMSTKTEDFYGIIK